jgi:hypothetical protein
LSHAFVESAAQIARRVFAPQLSSITFVSGQLSSVMATPAVPSEPLKDTIDDMLTLSALREDAKSELLELLEGISGTKCLITDVQLGGLLNQVIVEGSRFLKDNDVEHFRELRDEPLGHFINSEGLQAVPDNIIYLVRPQLPLMNLIASQMKSAEKNGIESNFHVYFVPQQFTVCVHLLEEQLDRPVLFNRIQFGEYKMGLIPYDSDVLSLEMEGCFKQVRFSGTTLLFTFHCLTLIHSRTHTVQRGGGLFFPQHHRRGAAKDPDAVRDHPQHSKQGPCQQESAAEDDVHARRRAGTRAGLHGAAAAQRA